MIQANFSILQDKSYFSKQEWIGLKEEVLFLDISNIKFLEINTKNSPVIRQKGESQSGCFKKTKHVQFPEKRTFLTPWHAHRVRTRVWEMFVFRKIGRAFFFLKPVLRFALLPYYRQIRICDTIRVSSNGFNCLIK